MPMFLGSHRPSTQRTGRVFWIPAPDSSLARIRNVPQVFASRRFSPVGGEVAPDRGRNPKVEAEPHVSACEFSGFSDRQVAFVDRPVQLGCQARKVLERCAQAASVFLMSEFGAETTETSDPGWQTALRGAA